MTTQRIAVIGSGPAGAAAAHTLASAGHTVRVFERAEHIGGRTYTHREGSWHLDTGAGFITNFYPRTLGFADTLGFSSRIHELHRVTGLHRDDTLAMLDITSTLSFMRFPFLGFADKWRMARWTAGLTLKRARYDIATPESLEAMDHRSIGDMARAELSEALYHTLVRPGIEPFWYFDCEEVSAALAEALSAHAAGAKFYAIAGGIDHICAALLGDIEVTTGAEVKAVTQAPQGADLRWAQDGQEHSEPFDRVVIATTATVANRLTKSCQATSLNAAQRGFLESQEYAANVHICFRVPRLNPPAPFNAIFPCGRDRAPLAALAFHRKKSPTERDDPSELVSVYLSDPESRRVLEWDDERLASHCLALGRAVFAQLPASAEIFHISRRREAIPLHRVGRYRHAIAFNEAQMASTGPIYFCGDYLATATIDGAIETGLRAAAALLQN